MVKITQMKKTTLRQSALRLALVALVLLSPFGLRAQTLSEYTLETSTETYTSIADDALRLTSVSGDGGTQTVALPFNFPFGETTYTAGTNVTVRADGYLYFGSTSPGHSSKAAWTNTTSNYYVIAPFLNYDGKITSSGATSGAYCTTDDPDNPTMLIIEFKGLQCYYSPYGDYNFQVRLYANGNISVIYGSSTLSTYSSASHNFFIKAKEDQICLTGSYAEPVAGTPAALPNFTTAPAEGQVITFVRPVITCPKPVSILVTDASAPDALTVEWVAGGGESEWNVYLNGVQVNTEPITEQTYTFQNLTANTPYTLGVTAVCGTDDESLPRTTTARTACAAIDDLTTPYTMGFETDDLQGTTNTLSIPWCWKRLNNATSSSYNYYPYAYNSSSDAHGGSRYLRFYYYNYSWSSQADYQIVVLPEIDVDALPLSTLRLRFYARSYSSYSGDISVGTMADPDDPESFSEVESFNITGTTYDLKTVATFPDNGNRYIAIRMLKPSAADYQYAYIDDLTLELLPNCLEPTDLHEVANSATTESVELEWTGHGESEWELYYTDDPADVPDENTTPSETTDQNPFTLEGLTSATHYYVYVRANCGGDQSPWSQRSEFTTACDAVTTFPWSENFESRASGNFSDPCWVNEHLVSVSNRTDVFKVYTSTNGTNSTHQLQLPDMNAGNTVKLRLPEMTLPNDNYQFTIDFYRNNGSYGSYITEGVSVFASTDGEIEGATLLAFIPRPHSTSNSTGATTIPEETAAGWYTYELPIGFSGTCYIILRGESQYGSATYMDNLVVEQVPTCRKPKTPVCSAKTAHTATLSWTNGAEGQNAWQIAYKATDNFNPNEASELATATIVDADANPYTIGNLVQHTPYYAYVRANCGGEYSNWSVANVNFTTEWGNVTPTGLAVAASTITSTEATATWNAVAGNTLHQSYDLYWAVSTTEAPVTAVPDEPAAPNLISGINGESYHFTELTPETTYRIWVRDNCGTDGISTWSSYHQFTTAEDCQTPDNLVASNVTAHSATISWAAYGQTAFNLRYSTDGENWAPLLGVSNPYTFNGTLTDNTTYQVQVQAQCNTEAWSTSLNFTTKCVARDDFPITYGFETSEGFTAASNATTNTLGNCWRNQATSNTGSYYARLWSASSSSHHGEGAQSLVLPDKSNFNTTLLAFPAMNFTSANGYHVSFWINRSASSSNPEGFKVYASNTDTIDASAVFLGHYSRNYGIAYPVIESASGWYQYDFYIPQSTITGIVYLIFEGQSYYGNATYVDDITIEEAPACLPVGTLTYDPESVTPFAANLSWTLIDNAQDGWRITYAQDANFIEDMHAITVTSHENYTLSGLTPETHYYVAVCAFCGASGYGAASNIIEFTTGIACQKPTDLAYSNLQQTSVDLSWTENGTASAWKVAYKAEGAEEFSETMVLENPYTLGGLTQGTNYTVKVRAMCGGDYGNSQWSDEINFQTIAACPAPTNLAVTTGSETAHGATITWEGNSDNDSYIIEYAEGPLAGVATLIDESFDGDDMPTGWSIMGLGTGNWSVSSTDNAGGDANELHLYYSPSFDGTSRLVTPAIDLTGISEVTFTFKHNFDHYDGSHALGIATSSDGGTTWNDGWNESYSADASGTISEVISTSDMGNANVLFCIYYTGYSYNIDNWYFDDITVTAEYNPTYIWNELASGVTGNTYTINTLDPETQYVVRVKGMCGTTPSPASNIVGFETPEACPAPTGFTMGTVTAHEATFSWTAGTSTEWDVYVKAQGGDFPTTPNATVTTPTATINTLSGETTYSVKIVPTCDETKSLEVTNAFTTEVACAKPTDLNVTDITGTTANIEWDGTNDGYNVRYRAFTGENNQGFECGMGGWTTIDADGDGYTWVLSEVAASVYHNGGVDLSGQGHNLSEDFVCSGSYSNVAGILTPDNYLVSPQITLGGSISFYAQAQDMSYPTEHFGVAVSTSGNTDADDFTTIQEWDMVADYAANNTSGSTWGYYTVDLSAYSGQGYVAIRHFDCTDMFILNLDDIEIVQPGATEEPWTTVKNITENELPISDLNPETTYEVQVQGKCNGESEPSNWVSTCFITLPPAITIGIEANKWYAIASPVHNLNNDQTLAGVTNLTNGTNDLFGYDGDNGTWVKPTSILSHGYGYIYRNANNVTLSFNGQHNSGSFTLLNLSTDCTDDDLDGFNLLGNPYTHPIARQNFYRLNTNGTWLAQDEGNIQVAEGFLVKSSSSDYIFNDVVPSTSKHSSNNAALAFTVSNEEFEDVAYARFDNGEGLPKIGHLTAEAPMLSIPVDSRRYAIANVGNDCESFNLAFRGTNGSYTLTLKDNMAQMGYVHLIDRATGRDIDLLRQSYTFSATGNDADRFTVKLSPDAIESTEGHFAYWNGDNWVVEGNGKLQVIDVVGRQVLSQEVDSQTTLSNAQFPGTGVYILRMAGKSQKIVVK